MDVAIHIEAVTFISRVCQDLLRNPVIREAKLDGSDVQRAPAPEDSSGTLVVCPCTCL